MSEKKREAVVAGQVCLDLMPVFRTKETNHIEEILIPSSTVYVGKADIHAGGCVTNTGLAMKIFGTDVCLMAKVADDDFGKIILRQYGERVSTENMIVSKGDEGTSYSMVIAPAGIDRIFLHCPGVNDNFDEDDLDYDLIGTAKLFHFGYPQAMRRMYINGGKELSDVFRRVKERDVTTSMDTSGLDPNSEAGKTDWREILQKVIPDIDIFVPSVEELCYMMDRDKFDEWTARANGKGIGSFIRREDVAPLAEELLSWGAKVLMIKCGAAGMYFAVNGKKELEKTGSDLRPLLTGWADTEHFEHSFRPKKILSATGAGDTCIAAFLTAMLRGYGWEKCLMYASATGAACLEAYDSLSGLLSFEELDKRIRDGWEKNT